MKGNQNLPNRQVTSNHMTGNHSHIGLVVTVETEIIQDTEVHISIHKTTQNHITVIVILNHLAEMVHHIQKQTSKKVRITLDQNHPKIVEMEIAHNNHSHEIALKRSELY